jgi:hypothetical protein
VEENTVAPGKRLGARLFAAASAVVAGLMLAGALAGPAQAYANLGAWNHGCRAGWDNYEGAAWCSSTGNGVGEMKLKIDRAFQTDYDSGWKNATTSGIGPIFCTFECRSASLSRQGY